MAATTFDPHHFTQFYLTRNKALVPQVFKLTGTNLAAEIAVIDENDKKFIKKEKLEGRNAAIRHPLTAEFSRVDFVPGLKTTLYGHQQTAVMAMLQMELYRNFHIIPQKHKDPRNTPEPVCFVNFNCAVLSEPPGSGKTIEILSLILLSRVPKPMPDIRIFSRRDLGLNSVTVKYAEMFPTSIVICGASVLRQWLATIKLMTDLRVFCVVDVRGLREFFNLVESRRLSQYDVVLAKNGYVTVPITLPGGQWFSPEDNKKSRHICSAMAAALRNYCVSRVVIDDFDTIKLPACVQLINAYMTWYVSATRRAPHSRNHTSSTYLNSPVEELINYHERTLDIYNGMNLFQVVNVRNHPDHIKTTAQVPYPKYHVMQCTGGEARFVNLVNMIGNREIMEMINADAVGEAAQRIGINTTSVSDVFAALLGTRFTTYKDAIEHIKFIEYNVENADLRLPLSAHPDPPPHSYGKTNLRNYDDIEYQYVGINILLKECHEEYKHLRDTNGKEIERVKDNLKHGACPVCTTDLQEVDNNIGIIVNKCCSATFCGSCGFRMQKEGVCVVCRQRVTMNSLIFIGEDVKLDDIQEDNFEPAEPDADAADTQISNTAAHDTQDSNQVPSTPLTPYEQYRATHLEKAAQRREKPTKLEGLLDILYGFNGPYSMRADMHIPAMMKGACYLPDSPTRKVMVFANFEEAIGKIIKQLTDAHVKFWRLQGTVDEISRTAFDFNSCTETCVLVINSAKHCSGLNLQTATDHIFWHYIEDINVESQVIGRGQRLGRTSCLRVWYLCYDNEISRCKSAHNMRPLSAEELSLEEKFMSHAAQSTIGQIADGAQRVHDFMADEQRGRRRRAHHDTEEDNNEDNDENTAEHNTIEHNIDVNTANDDENVIEDVTDMDDDELITEDNDTEDYSD